MTAITFTFCLTAGLWGLWHLVEHRASQRWLRWHGVTCLVGLLVAGFCGGREVARKNSTQVDATQLLSTRVDATRQPSTQLNTTPLPSIAFDPRWGAKRESDYLARWREVYAAIGPPPQPDAVPKRGYVRAGKVVAPAWQTKPDGSEENNLVR